MKLVVIGATGRTGGLLTQQALDAGHEVLAILRNAEKLDSPIKDHANFKYEQASIFSADELVALLRGADCVLSCLNYQGVKTLPFQKMDFYTSSCNAIVDAMKKAGVRRFITMTMWFTENIVGMPFFFRLASVALGRYQTDMRSMELYLASERDSIDYTVVRSAELMNTPKTDLAIMARPGEMFVDGASTKISRADVARYMLACIDDRSTFGQEVAIAVFPNYLAGIWSLTLSPSALCFAPRS